MPAKTVTSLAGFLPFSTANRAARRAFAAEHPQAELTTTETVPSDGMTVSTSSLLFNSRNPAYTNSWRIGGTKYSGYISLKVYVKKYRQLFISCYRLTKITD